MWLLLPILSRLYCSSQRKMKKCRLITSQITDLISNYNKPHSSNNRNSLSQETNLHPVTISKEPNYLNHPNQDKAISHETRSITSKYLTTLRRHKSLLTRLWQVDRQVPIDYPRVIARRDDKEDSDELVRACAHRRRLIIRERGEFRSRSRARDPKRRSLEKALYAIGSTSFY